MDTCIIAIKNSDKHQDWRQWAKNQLLLKQQTRNNIKNLKQTMNKSGENNLMLFWLGKSKKVNPKI